MTNKKTKNQRSHARIISGSLRHRHIEFTSVGCLRPTMDRVRETLFNWLQPYIQGSRCLDLFAGAGALGFEAASRGAEQVVFVEQDYLLYEDLLQNVSKFDLDSCCRVIHRSFSKKFDLEYEPFDIVFLDPPYNTNLLADSMQWLLDNAMIHENSLIYIENSAQWQLELPVGLEIIKQKKTKSIFYALCEIT